MMRQDRFTEQAQKVLGHSQELVRAHGHSQWDVEHVLQALAAADGLAADLLDALGVDRAKLQADATAALEASPKTAEVVQIYTTPRIVKMLERANAEAERLKARHAARATPPNVGNRPGTNRKRKPRKTPGDRYDVAAYRRAVERACVSAGVSVWSPGRLRHTRATSIRSEHGLEAARVILGHADSGVTAQHYAEIDRSVARKIMEQVG